MTKININLTSVYNVKSDKFYSYLGEVKADNLSLFSERGFVDLKKFAFDVLFEVAYSNIQNPEYCIQLTRGEELGIPKKRYNKKPFEEDRDKLIRGLKSKELNRRAKSLANLCLK